MDVAGGGEIRAGGLLAHVLERLVQPRQGAAVPRRTRRPGGRAHLRAYRYARADHAAAIACYPLEGRDLAAAIRTLLGEAQLRVDDDAMAFLVDHLGADLAVTQREIEKLALYAGAG
eukprot:gene38609-52166_t